MLRTGPLGDPPPPYDPTPKASLEDALDMAMQKYVDSCTPDSLCELGVYAQMQLAKACT